MKLAPCFISRAPVADCVYTACDTGYFQEFGKAFAHSVLANTDLGVHFHLFNPDQPQLDYCEKNPRISYSHETIGAADFEPAAQRWITVPQDPVEQSYLKRTQNAMDKGHDRNILARMQKTYFACVRFVRLSEIFDASCEIFAMDVDAVVRAQLRSPGNQHAFYIHRIHGRKARYLAGGIWLNANPDNTVFLADYAAAIQDYFHRDYIYWGIDQDILEHTVPRHNHGELPMTYIDWNMRSESWVWTAKGTRKNDSAFLAVMAQYS